MRILVMLLLDTLPMLGNVLLLCLFVFFIFDYRLYILYNPQLHNHPIYISIFHRYAHPGDVAIGYPADAWQRAPSLLLRLLHLRHHRSAAVGRVATATLLSGAARECHQAALVST